MAASGVCPARMYVASAVEPTMLDLPHFRSVRLWPAQTSMTLVSTNKHATLPVSHQLQKLPYRPHLRVHTPHRPVRWDRSTVVYAEWPQLDERGKAVPAPALTSNQHDHTDGLKRTLLLGVLFSGWCDSSSAVLTTVLRMFRCNCLVSLQVCVQYRLQHVRTLSQEVPPALRSFHLRT